MPACGDDDRPRVLVLGDSITVLVADDLENRDDSDFRLTVRATNNATSVDMLAAAREVAGTSFSQVIINLGTNDVGDDLPVQRTTGAVREMLGLFGGADCVHLTTINEQALFGGEPVLEPAREINDRYRGLADDRDRVYLVDWNEAVENNQASDRTGGAFLSDTVHPTDRGQDVLVDLYLDAAERCA